MAFDRNIGRKVILNPSPPGAGKTSSIVQLALALQEYGKKLVVIDRDRGFAEALVEFSDSEMPENLEYHFIKTWDDVEIAVNDALDTLDKDDWFVAEHAGRIWEFVREQFCQRTYGMSHAQLLNTKRQAAEEKIRDEGITDPKAAYKVRAKALAYSGLDGRMDWVPIKSAHNNDLFEKLIFDGEMNILTTTTWNPLDKDSAEQWPEWKLWGRRPSGEKEQVARHSSVVGTYYRDGEYYWRNDFGDASKDRGKELVKDVPFTKRSWLESYCEYYDIPLVRS